MAMQQQQGETKPIETVGQMTVGEALQRMRGDYTHGHPGLPPKDYQAPKEKRR